MIELDVLRWVELLATVGAAIVVVWRVARTAGRVEAVVDGLKDDHDGTVKIVADLDGRVRRLEYWKEAKT